MTRTKDFNSFYADLVERHIGRRPRHDDGIPESEIKLREGELGIQFPASLRAYYRTAGKLSQVNKMHNILYDPSGVTVEDGYLVFMEENQEVVHWCFRISDLKQPDPEVWQRVNSEPPEWHSEEMPFSTFIARMFDWQTGSDRGKMEEDGAA